ncbi:heavy metal translocating P-type ATPase [Miltoncostaea marina]|uniref:heavy metal translocating P-type ATPase n=1 Tax=Miltoncostaea marina TaxID=2843215 RepID=UPI001C3D47CF|nr:cation-translocating P-type ATPase [Miltoncostaea marina]
MSDEHAGGVAAGATPALSWREAAVRFAPLRNALISGVLLGLGVALTLLDAPEGLAIALFVAAILIGAWFFAREGWQEFVEEREIGIEALMLIAAIGCIVFGLWEEAAALVFLYALAESIEELTFARTRSAIRGLLDLAPKRARRVVDDAEEDVPADELHVGDLFRVRPGEALPTDGIIRAGRSSFDEAAVTGESVPIEKGPGDEVFAGTLNGAAGVDVEATRAYADNTLQRIVHLVEEAQGHKSRAQRFVDRFATRYSPAVVVAAALVALLGGLVAGDWTEWALRGVTVLVAGAPCALVMSVPVAAAAAISRAGREGILVKGGLQLEALGRVQAVAFDKTGTLTKGRPEVTEVVALGAADEREALALAASVEARSEHPLAQAIVDHARGRGVEPGAVEDFTALVGSGASARVDGREAWVGSPRLVAERVGEDGLPAEVGRLQDEGKTVVFVGAGDQLLALLALRDEPRPEAAGAVAALRRLGIRHLSMLTGDNERTARAIAAELGLDEVFAELKPEEKVAQVTRLRERFGSIAMVGDGINDAPALATADLGIAMGTGGTDAAIEAADVALMADDLTTIAEALRLGRRATRISRQNLVFSVVLLAVLIPSAVIGALAVVAAVAVHEVSELLAVANGVRAAKRPQAGPSDRLTRPTRWPVAAKESGRPCRSRACRERTGLGGRPASRGPRSGPYGPAEYAYRFERSATCASLSRASNPPAVSQSAMSYSQTPALARQASSCS